MPKTAIIVALITCISLQSAPIWEIRRTRTSDAVKAGGWPEWRVQIDQTDAGANVLITESDGKNRGVLYIGARVRVPDRNLLTLTGSFATFCALGHRSGNLSLVVLTESSWDQLTDAPHTEIIDGADRAMRPIWRRTIHPMDKEDVQEPIPIPREATEAMSYVVRSRKGETVVIALCWMGAHTAVEHATFVNLRVETHEPENPMEALFGRLDLQQPGLEKVKDQAKAENWQQAAEELLIYFRNRFQKPRPTEITKGTLEEADKALENRFRSCGSSEFFELHKDFEWHQNAIDDKEWLLHFQWHHILRTLVEAGAVQNDDRYTAKTVELIRDWIPANDPGSPWSWRTLEVSLRAMNWTDIFPYLVHFDGFTPRDAVDMLYTLSEHLDWLLPPERFHSGHNFGTTESKALLTVGLTMTEFKNAELWRTTAWHRFEHEITAQVLPDGAQVELTTGYHNGVLNSFLEAARLVEKSGIKPSREYWQRLEKMHDYTLFLTKPDGSQPNLGDSWNGRQNKILERGAHIFDRPDMLFVGTAGKEGKRPDYLDTQLPSAGYYVMRTTWDDDPDGIYVLLDAARHWGGWHQHYDALGLIVYAYGKTLTPDAGPFAYGSPLRDVFQGTPAHSTVCIDESNQNTSPCTLHHRHSGNIISLVEASHSGYPGITHTRNVLFVRSTSQNDAYVLVFDRIDGKGEHTVDANFHLFETTAEIQTEKGLIWTTAQNCPNIAMQGLALDGVKTDLLTSWITAGYNRKHDRLCVRFRQKAPLPVTFITLLFPYRGDDRLIVNATLDMQETGNTTVCIKGPWGKDTITVPAMGTEQSANQPIAGIVRQAPDGILRAQETVAP